MNKKILILGRGFIGSRMADATGWEISGRRINSLSDARDEIDSRAPDVIINCIGYTGENNVDDCERNPDKTLFANSFLPLILAEAASERGVKLVHISSGCIYKHDDGGPPIEEDAPPDFFGLAYSRSKIYAERALSGMSEEYGILILRVRIPLDDRPHPKNLLTKLLEYGRVIDVPNSVTYVPDFIDAVRHLLDADARGVFNVVNKGGIRYPRLMEAYSRRVPGFAYDVIGYDDMRLLRTNLILSTAKLEGSGFNVRNINEVIEQCVRDYLLY